MAVSEILPEARRLLEAAKRERGQLAARLAKLDAFIEGAEGLFSDDMTSSTSVRGQESVDSTSSERGAERPITGEVSRTRYYVTNVKRPPGLSHGHMPSVVRDTRDAVRLILQRNERPTHIRELLTEVLKQGIEVGGKDPIATLSARLSNSPEFRVKRGVGWWFSHIPADEFDEAEGQGVESAPSASNTSNEEDSHATALALNPDR